MFGIVYGSDSDNKIMNRFVDEYELWCNEGKNPDIASIDLDFALDLQKKRLDEKGVKIQTAFTDKETVKNEVPINACTAYDMGECKSNVASKTYGVTEKYFKDGKKKKKIKDRFFFYTMITRLENQNSRTARRTFGGVPCMGIKNAFRTFCRCGKEHSYDRSALQLPEKTSVAYERG